MGSTDPFIPSSVLPVDPEDALADLEADFDGISAPPDVVIVPDDVPPLGRSWGFDFVGAGFMTSGTRQPVQTNDLSTLIQWIEKALRTAKGSPLHPPDYGMDDPETLIGRVVSGAPVGELEQEIRDALTFHSRISDVRDFAFDLDPAEEWVAASFTVVLDDARLLQLNATLAATVVAAEF